MPAPIYPVAVDGRRRGGGGRSRRCDLVPRAATHIPDIAAANVGVWPKGLKKTWSVASGLTAGAHSRKSPNSRLSLGHAGNRVPLVRCEGPRPGAVVASLPGCSLALSQVVTDHHRQSAGMYAAFRRLRRSSFRMRASLRVGSREVSEAACSCSSERTWPTSSRPTTSLAVSRSKKGSRPMSPSATPGLKSQVASSSTRSSKCRD
jgi:hypothetical protein